jgi:hypothetical protein
MLTSHGPCMHGPISRTSGGRGGIDCCGGVPSGGREEAVRTAEEAVVGRDEEAAAERVEDSDTEELDGG